MPVMEEQTNVFKEMESVLETLHILDYEAEYCDRNHTPKLSRTFFALPAQIDARQQFVTFTSLASWLIQMCGTGAHFTVEEYDDPNTQITNLMHELSSMGYESSFSTTKLKQGWGEGVVAVLGYLANRALERRGFRFAPPTYPADDFAEEAEVDADAEFDAEEEMGEDIGLQNDSDDDEEEMWNGGGGGKNKKKGGNDDSFMASGQLSLDMSQRGILKSDIDPIEWKTELERVTPQLRNNAKLGASGKEWRSHLEQTMQHEKTIGRSLPDARGALTAIMSDVSNMLERVETKETYLNRQFEKLGGEYREVKERLDVMQKRHEESSGDVGTLSSELADISDRLDEVKSSMDERGNSMTDTSPLVRIKKALKKLQKEMKHMELRMGVACHSLLQAKIRQRNENANNPDGLSKSGAQFTMEDDEDMFDDI